MKNLFKYELRKTLFPKLVMAGITVLVEVFFLISLYRDKVNQQAVAVGILVALASFGIVFMGIQSLVALHRDMNTRQGYMLFMTPNSSYRILGAKVLENTVSTLLAGAFYFLLGLLDISLIAAHNHDLTEMLSMLRDLASGIGVSLNYSVADIAFFTLYMLLSWLSTITLAYFADILVSSVLNGRKLSGLLGFILFLILAYVTGKIGNLLPAGNTTPQQCGIGSAYYAIIIVLTYFGSAKLMERHLSI